MLAIRKDIEDALARPVCGGWDRGFLESILSQLDRGRELSDKQISTATKVVQRNGPEAQAVHDEWQHVYENDFKDEAMVLARYYKTTGYFTDLTNDILAGIVPDMRGYTKMSGNKYAQKVIETHRTKPIYESGTLVEPRASVGMVNIRYGEVKNSALSYVSARAFKSKGGIVLCVTDEIRSAARGAKTYKILPIGSSIPVFVEERHIKLKRK